MGVRIRLARFGRKHSPFYRIWVMDSRRARNGKFIEQVGTYNPLPSAVDNMKEVRLQKQRIEYWLSQGAQPTASVARLLGDAGIIPPHVPRVSGNQGVKKADRSFSTVTEGGVRRLPTGFATSTPPSPLHRWLRDAMAWRRR
jgi:small subunit ribosomal protein S16|tara:strand:- start:6 stop:431 length:426 start_codon:yes stop_codon:yes gene_type:complete